MPKVNDDLHVGIAIDFETSGYDPRFACALGLVRIEGGKLGKTWYSLLKPPSPMVLFTEIHGLTWADLKDAPTFEESWDEIASFAAGASFFVAHNAPFDRRVLNACLRAADLPLCDLPFFCTLKGARKGLKKLPSRSLSALSEHFHIPLNHHHAASDAEACARIFLALQDLGVGLSSMRLS